MQPLPGWNVAALHSPFKAQARTSGRMLPWDMPKLPVLSLGERGGFAQSSILLASTVKDREDTPEPEPDEGLAPRIAKWMWQLVSGLAHLDLAWDPLATLLCTIQWGSICSKSEHPEPAQGQGKDVRQSVTRAASSTAGLKLTRCKRWPLCTPLAAVHCQQRLEGACIPPAVVTYRVLG